MKWPAWILCAGMTLATGAAWAQGCSCVPTASRLNAQQLGTTISGRTVCAVLGAERWQEFHQAGFNLLELGNKAGGEVVGAWSVVGQGGSAVLRYTYSGGGSYDYQVCEEGTGAIGARSYHFCGAKNITNARLVDGTGSCGSGFTRP